MLFLAKLGAIGEFSAAMPALNSHNRWIALVILLTGTFLISLITTFASLAYHANASPMLLILSRFTALVITLAIILRICGTSFTLPTRSFRATFWIAGCLMMMSVGYLSAVLYIKVSLAVVLLYTYPLLVAVFAAISGRERIHPVRAVMLICAFIGLVIALGEDLGLPLGANVISLDFGNIGIDLRGAALALMAAIGIATFITWGGTYLDAVDSRVMNFWVNLWMAGLAAFYVIFIGGVSLPQTTLGWIGYGGATGCYVAAMICCFTAMKILSPTETATILNLEPAISLTAATVILREPTTLQQWIGTSILLISIIFLGIMARRLK